MSKAYINDGIVGNSRMLGCVTDVGELHRLFWPDIDHLQHIDRFQVGFQVGNADTVFLHDPSLEKEQEYRKGTNILITSYWDKKSGLRIIQSDFCLIDRDVFIRRYEIENHSKEGQVIRWMVYSSCVTSASHYAGTLFDFDHEALVHYQRDQYMSVSTDLEVESFQLGGASLEALKHGSLDNAESVLMVPEGALTWKVGRIDSGDRKELTMQLCFSDRYQKLKELIKEIRGADGKELYRNTESYWREYVKTHRITKTKNPAYDELYERTILVFRLMYNEVTGALMAAPEVDENMDRCGRYAYCWGRDAAFISDAMDQCGLQKEVEKFFYYAASVQEENGSWFQRYCMDGNLAPAWGLQVDETGALLYGMWKHFDRTGDKEFLHKIWENVKRAADFLVHFIDPETGLPKHSRDLWEERWGEHTYSAASVHAGLIAAQRIAKQLGLPEEVTKRWSETACSLKAAIQRELWDEKKQCYLRGIRTQLYPESKMDGKECMLVTVNSKGAQKKVVCRDEIVDISLIGLAIPFGVVDVEDPRMVATAKAIEEKLTAKGVGGILRYEEDEYIGGNPWILTTLWLALYFIEKKDYDKALTYFDWSVEGRTKLNLLPEQVSKETGKPVWIIPLTWSHAMYVLAYQALREKGLI